MAPTVEERTLRMLIAKKEYYFAKIQTLFDLAKKLEETGSRERFLKGVGSLEKSRSDLGKIVDDIILLRLEIEDGFEPKYDILNTVDQMCDYIRVAERTLQVGNSDHSLSNAERLGEGPILGRSSARLPKIELPQFSGELRDWEAFYDMFKHLVHENSKLSDMEKLYYLVGCLKGQAKTICAGLSMAQDNYIVIWEALVERYHDKRALANAYSGQILEWRDLREESERGLNSFLEKFDASVRALRNLNLKDLADFMFLHHALSRLNPETVNYFEINRHSDSVPQYEEELLEFIKLRVKTLATGKHKNFGKPREPDCPKVKVQSKTFMVNKESSVEAKARQYDKCHYCHRSRHILNDCQGFLKLSPKNRYYKVKELNLCYNCLSADHGVRACSSSSKCEKCSYRHHNLIHHERVANTSENPAPEKGVSLYSAKTKEVATVLLGTARVRVEDPLGCGEGRFLLDSGSQANLVSQNFCHKLGLPISKLDASVQALGGVSQPVRGLTTFTVFPHFNKNISFSVTALVVGKISGPLPQTRVNLRNRSWLRNLPLADRGFDQPGPIEGMFGAEIFASVLGSEHRKEVNGGPMAMETSLGYVIMGRIPMEDVKAESVTLVAAIETQSVEEMVRQFWEMETISENKTDPPDQEECEEIFKRETFRDETGRFTVALPFKQEPNALGDSKMMARRRYLALESRFEKNPEFKKAYHKAMADFIDQGHICPVTEPFLNTPVYYIPHHAVYKSSRDSTPVRIVLDASAPSTNGLSLNSILHIGPKLQADIGAILMRFRLFPVVLAADVRQMYRQINVVANHRRFQRLFWRWSPEEPLRTWELRTLAFGVAASPYLALRCVRELLKIEGQDYPKTAALIRDSLYMDDLLVSVPTIGEAEKLYRESNELFQRGQFDLTKWISNSGRLLEIIPLEKRIKTNSLETFKTKINVLGLIWDSREDNILINFPVPVEGCTKRGILSSVARCFDPLGISAPVILYLKILVKELWTLKLGWDDEAPQSIQRRWKKITVEWPSLRNLIVKRSFNLTPEAPVNLLGFADASKDGFGGVVYLQSLSDSSDLQIVCAKSRVSPVKSMSIPRLELSAALLLANLLSFVSDALIGNIKVMNIFGFSDSSTVLQWLNATMLKDTFVNNRVTKIREVGLGIKWKHISGKDNPADELSRGCTPVQLLESELWLNGPWWARLPENEWPCLSFVPASDNLATPIMTLMTTEPEERHPLLKLIDRKSSWSEILRVTVWVLRWTKVIPKGMIIASADLQEAERVLIMLVQREHFGNDFRALETQKEPSKRLRNLRPFIHRGVLRVGGRLSNSTLPFDQRHQIILPKKDCLAERLVTYYHVKHLHTGPYLVEALLRQKFWILGGKALIKKIIRACNHCFKWNPKFVEPLMADLPEARVRPSKAFLTTGVDYFGPITITLSRRRGSTTWKAYVALFVCTSVKAIHLELVSSLSTNHFLQAFKRFLSRRGPCKILYSDRGTNFLGARRVLSDLDKLVTSQEFGNIIGRELSENQVEWKFNPPAAPHMEGLWESQVKIVKRHLLRVIGKQLLSYEELNTLLVQVEGLLNSRPLCQLSTDPSAPTALTPGHFLHQAPLEYLPTEQLLETNVNRLNRFQLLDHMVQSFWKRWHLEYLTLLQARQKWNRNTENLKLGTIVLIKTENCALCQWPMGIITAVFPGRDGVVRSVKIRCGQREWIRPAVKVCPLPTQ